MAKTNKHPRTASAPNRRLRRPLTNVTSDTPATSHSVFDHRLAFCHVLQPRPSPRHHHLILVLMGRDLDHGGCPWEGQMAAAARTRLLRLARQAGRSSPFLVFVFAFLACRLLVGHVRTTKEDTLVLGQKFLRGMWVAEEVMVSIARFQHH